MAVLLFGCVVKMSDWLLSEKDLSLVGGIAHICPVSEEDRMAAAKADLQMKTLPEPVFITCNCIGGNSDLKSQGKQVVSGSYVCLKQPRDSSGIIYVFCGSSQMT